MVFNSLFECFSNIFGIPVKQKWPIFSRENIQHEILQTVFKTLVNSQYILH